MKFKGIKIDAAVFVKITLALFILFIFSFYFYGRSKNFLQGPEISINYPENGETIYSSFVKIKGKVMNAAVLYIDGSRILADSLGNFEKEMILAQGYNIIDFKVEDKFGRSREKKIEVAVK